MNGLNRRALGALRIVESVDHAFSKAIEKIENLKHVSTLKHTLGR